MTQKTENKPGKAYGFFDCEATKGEIKGWIPQVREASKTPKQLELILTKDIDLLEVDSDLLQISQKLDSKYVMEANYQGGTNEETAKELGAILNNLFQSPAYKPGEKFSGEIVYKENKNYIFRE